MSVPSPWLPALVSTLLGHAPDLRSGSPRDAPAMAATAVASLVPGVDACAVVFPVLRSDGRVDRPFPAAGVHPALRAVLTTETAARSGPVRDVARANDPVAVHVPDVLRDPRWPALGRRLRDLPGEVRALDVVPVHVASRGALLLASGAPGGLDAVEPDLGGIVAAVELFLRLAWAETRASHARDGLAAVQVIGTATGVVMARDGMTTTAAVDALRTIAQRSGRALRDVAAEVVAASRPHPEPLPGESAKRG